MSIKLTEIAAEHIKKELAKRPEIMGLRLKIKKTGCSGFAYVVDYAEQQGTDLVYESHGVKIFVEPESLKFIAGTEIDFVTKGLSSSMIFNNPQAVGTCGCGESFSVNS